MQVAEVFSFFCLNVEIGLGENTGDGTVDYEHYAESLLLKTTNGCFFNLLGQPVER